MTTEAKEIYFNEPQIQFALSKAKIRVWVGGRGSGKSTEIALIIRMALESMPRAKGLFSSTTLEQIHNSTLPPVKFMLAEMGIHEDQHYVVGEEPPDNWKRPYKPLTDYTNSMSFFNGLTLVFISTAKPVGKRGGSYDFAIIDEAAFVKAATFKKVITPMVRDNLGRFNTTLHHSFFLFTSQPTTGDGHFIMQFEKEAIADPDNVLFLWTSARDNMVVLGVEWFERMKQLMGYTDYLSEIENEKIVKLPNGFYHTFERNKQGYRAGYDIDPDRLIELTWDFSGHFNCASLLQEEGGYEYIKGRYHTKQGERKVIGVVDKVCEDLRHHRFKYVRLWGEPRGKDDNELTDDDVYQTIAKHFMAKGWEVEERVGRAKKAARHKQRFHLFEEIFAETNPTLPKIRINLTRCEDVVISIERTKCLPNYQKDKSTEGDPNYPQEHSVHYTDGIDNYVEQKYGWMINNPSDEPGWYHM